MPKKNGPDDGVRMERPELFGAEHTVWTRTSQARLANILTRMGRWAYLAASSAKYGSASRRRAPSVRHAEATEAAHSSWTLPPCGLISQSLGKKLPQVRRTAPIGDPTEQD